MLPASRVRLLRVSARANATRCVDRASRDTYQRSLGHRYATFAGSPHRSNVYNVQRSPCQSGVCFLILVFRACACVCACAVPPVDADIPYTFTHATQNIADVIARVTFSKVIPLFAEFGTLSHVGERVARNSHTYTAYVQSTYLHNYPIWQCRPLFRFCCCK